MVNFSSQEWKFLETSNVARFGTISSRGMPHVVPICYVLYKGDICIPIDIRMTRKKNNLEQNRKVCLIVDEYIHEDYSKLKGIIIQGEAQIIKDNGEFLTVRELVHKKYTQFEKLFPIDNEGKTHWIIKIRPTRIASWGIKK